MKYKIGDRIRIKSWNELVNEFGIDSDNEINLHGSYYWSEYYDNNLPNNRIISITEFEECMTYACYINKDGDIDCLPENIIKGYANEYYLQQIKEEINNEV